MPQQVDEARVLVPVAPLRSHPVVQILTAAAREPERAHEVRVVRRASRSQRLARVARGVERDDSLFNTSCEKLRRELLESLILISVDF